MAKSGITDSIGKDVEFVERLANVTEELGELVKVTQGKKKLEKPVISRRDIISIFREGRPAAAAGIPKSLLSIFRLLVVKNLIRGRLFTTAYSSGKEIGLSVSLKSKEDFIKTVKRFGLGKTEVTKFTPDNVRIKLSDGITSAGVKHSRRPICFFEAGIFAGFLESVFRKGMDVREIKCQSMGHACCRFELSQVAYEGHKPQSPYSLEEYSQENIKLLTSLAVHSITAIENAILFEKTRRQAIIDGLTQVYNHRYFQTRVNVEYRRAQRYNFPITLFMMDVDNFKKFNDQYGHPKGDDVLKMVASVLVRSLRVVDIVARYGGDEFAVILPQTDGSGAKIVAERIRKQISKNKLAVKNKRMNVTVSIGGLTLEPTVLTGKTLAMVELVDKLLLRAKRRGKNNLVLLKKA